MRKLVVLVAAALIAACTTIYPVVGRFDNYNAILYGTVNADLMAGTSYIDAQTHDGSLRCSGTSRVLYVPGINYILPTCRGQRGDADLSCNDGRHIHANWTAQGCTKGSGYGFDEHGARFTFTFGMSEAEAQAYLTTASQQVAALPDLPTYRPSEVRHERGFATGTGFLVSDNGLVVTNHHVIDGATTIEVQANGTSHTATIVTDDPTNDVTVLQTDIAGHGLPIASAQSMQRGDEVLTLGYPLIAIEGQSQKATFGRINALQGIADDVRFLQIDVPVQPGNSGGPLINRRGEVIGVVTATLDQFVALRASGSIPQNVNYAVKADYLIPLLRNHQPPPAQPAQQEFPDVVRSSEGSVFLVIAR